MMQDELLASDTSSAFDNLIANQSPWLSDRQNETALLVAKQKMLSDVIRRWKGVQGADVIISMPEDRGFGRVYVRPSASVNVTMRSGKKITRKMVDAFAGMVAGAVAEMTPEDVVVIDANMGRQYTVKSSVEQFADDAVVRLQQLEDYYHHKISDLILSFIPGAFVAVNVQMNPVVYRDVNTTEYDRSQLVQSERLRTEENVTKNQAAEPGARSNTMADIQTGGGAQTSSKVEESETTFGEKPVTQTATRREMGQDATKINVTVIVPDSYFRGVYRSTNSQAESEPSEADLQPLVTRELSRIEEMVKPLIETRDGEGLIQAERFVDPSRLMAALDQSPQSATMTDVLDSRWVKPVGLGLLALLSLAIMFGMVRKASQRPAMPSVEELAGVPPQLDSEEELIGEAAESEAEMGGMEVDEAEIRNRKLTEQISDLIKANPDEAARLVSRWVGTGD